MWDNNSSAQQLGGKGLKRRSNKQSPIILYRDEKWNYRNSSLRRRNLIPDNSQTPPPTLQTTKGKEGSYNRAESDCVIVLKLFTSNPKLILLMQHSVVWRYWLWMPEVACSSAVPAAIILTFLSIHLFHHSFFPLIHEELQLVTYALTIFNITMFLYCRHERAPHFSWFPHFWFWFFSCL